MTRPSTKLRANEHYIDNIDNFPFVLRLSKHERILSHTPRGKHAEDLVDQAVLKELEGESFFARLHMKPKEDGQ